MAYFLKKSKLKKGLYLQIYESFYDPERKQTAHKSFKAIGYEQELIAQGIEDPVSYYKNEVDKLNKQASAKKDDDRIRLISDESPEKYLGYFPLKTINDQLGTRKYIDLMQTAVSFQFNVFDLMSALIYSRSVRPCSKSKTYDEVIPGLFEKYGFSLSQLYSGLEYIGSEYEKIIEIYNHQISRIYPFDTSHTYFDCTNFYFEIDREDSLRRKGPSKENRKEPIVGMGLLLDAHQIPIGMKVYPGNESEKPVIRRIIDGLKQRNNISGRTIQVADKGLNCADNIYHALKEKDGYIFSKSVKQLPETEKTWILLDNDYREVKDASGNVLYRIKSCVDTFEYQISDENGRKRTVRIPEKRVVTYNTKLAQKQIYEINKQVEKARKLKACQAKKSEYGDSSKYVNFVSVSRNGEMTDGLVAAQLNQAKIDEDIRLAGYNLLVTSETKMSDSDIYAAYHNLWRIEESFRVMKSELDARPVYLQKEETIIGHFLICYLAVLLMRIFQFKVLDNRYCSEEVWEFIRNFKVAQISDRKYINLSRSSALIKELTSMTGLPLTSYFLNNTQIKSIFDHRF